MFTPGWQPKESRDAPQEGDRPMLDPQVLQAAENTDLEIYTTHDERGDYYGDKIFVTVSGGIGFNVGGRCIVKPLRDWFALAAPNILFKPNVE
jgi:hypothetical protein